MRALAACLLLACGGSRAPSAPAPASDGCPAAPLDRAVGTPCGHPGQTCGAERCQAATEFCNLITCRAGSWARVEVPPPPPPP